MPFIFLEFLDKKIQKIGKLGYLRSHQGKNPKDLKMKTKEKASRYLTIKQKNGSKGRDIIYEYLKLADYLKPDSNISTEDKRLIFSLRMNDIPSTFGIKTKCEVGYNETLTKIHILNCEVLNSNQTNTLEYTNILNESLNQMLVILTKMKQNIKI